MKNYLLVGADPSKNLSHKGGVLTLSIGIVEYSKANSINLTILNTLRSGINDLTFIKSFSKGLKRVKTLITLLSKSNYDGIIIISSASFSFYERIVMSLVARLYGVISFFLIVDGNFLVKRNKFSLIKFINDSMLLIPNYIGIPGGDFSIHFKKLNNVKSKIVLIKFWLPSSFVMQEFPKFKENNSTVNFVYVGWLIRDKGVLEILSALKLLGNYKNFTFTFVGFGPCYDNIRQFVQDFNLENQVFVLGKLEDNLLNQTLEQSDIFVLPSYFEGFPMTIIEALYKGLPVIATNVGGVSEAIIDGKNGFLINARNHYQLADAMKRYIVEPELITKHSRFALKTAQIEFNQQINCEKLFKIFEK